jgi:hypothetical protein
MPRNKDVMAWNGTQQRWEKMVKGKRLWVTCSTLAATQSLLDQFGDLPEHLWTEKGSYRHANGWLAEQLGQPTITERIVNAGGGLHDLADRVVKGQVAGEVLRSIIASPNLTDDDGIYEAMARATNPVPARPGLSVAECIDEYLSTLRRQKKPPTYREIAAMLATVKEWWGILPASTIDEASVIDGWKRIADMTIEPNTKKKRWGFVKRFIIDQLYRNRHIEHLPRNLERGSIYTFKQVLKAVDAPTLEEIRAELPKLPPKLRLYALLGLNCGMKNTDISEMRHDWIKDGYLKYKRKKLADVPNAPTTTYKLWPETLALLNQFKSNHPTLWLTTSKGTALVSYRLDGSGNSKDYDQILDAWPKECPITPSKWRNGAATLLESHEVYARYKDHFLNNTPQGIADRFYAKKSQDLFDKATDWLRTEVMG